MAEKNKDQMNEMDEHEVDQVTLTLEDDTELVCDILTIFPYEEKQYIALLPQTKEEEEGEIFLYQFVQHGEDDIELLDIEDDNEFEAVSEAFDELMDSELYDEMFDDEEEPEEINQ